VPSSGTVSLHRRFSPGRDRTPSSSSDPASSLPANVENLSPQPVRKPSSPRLRALAPHTESLFPIRINAPLPSLLPFRNSTFPFMEFIRDPRNNRLIFVVEQKNIQPLTLAWQQELNQQHREIAELDEKSLTRWGGQLVRIGSHVDPGPVSLSIFPLSNDYRNLIPMHIIPPTFDRIDEVTRLRDLVGSGAVRVQPPTKLAILPKNLVGFPDYYTAYSSFLADRYGSEPKVRKN
jgi:hypothetical protein